MAKELAPGKQKPPPEPPVKELWGEAKAADVTDNEVRTAVVEAWKQTVSVQMHFNEMCMTLRNIAITMLAGAIGLAAYSAKENIQMHVMGQVIPIGAVVALAGFIGWAAFYGMDVHWYHVFLRGAGTHAGRIETRWHKALPELLLSSQIREVSTRVVFGIGINSTRRLTTFYGIGAVILLITAVVAWNIEPAPPSPTSSSTPAAATVPGVVAPAPSSPVLVPAPNPAPTLAPAPQPQAAPAAATAAQGAAADQTAKPERPTPVR
jgi:hypothetical protein